MPEMQGGIGDEMTKQDSYNEESYRNSLIERVKGSQTCCLHIGLSMKLENRDGLACVRTSRY